MPSLVLACGYSSALGWGRADRFFDRLFASYRPQSARVACASASARPYRGYLRRPWRYGRRGRRANAGRPRHVQRVPAGADRNFKGIFHFLPLPRERAPWPPAPPGGSALGQGAERRCTVWTCRSGWEGVGPSGVLWGNDLGKGGWEADATPQRWETYFHYAHVASEITCDAVD